MSDNMTLEQFRAAKETGVDLYAEEQPQEVQEDAAPDDIPQDEPEIQEEVEQEQPEQEDDIPKEQQSAWQKRAERERRKGAEEAESRLKVEYEEKLNKLNRFFEVSGVDPDTAMKALEQNKLRAESRNAVMGEASRLAYQYGWDDQQTEEYISKQSELLANQRLQQNELRELRVSVAINDLADKPEYPGIKGMKSQIMEFTEQNPGVSVDRAYYAIGGPALVQQLKREAEQREIAKRSQPTRKVVTDAGKATDNKGSLPQEVVDFMKREGLSEAQARFLMDDTPKNLQDYRKMKGRN